MFLEVPPIFLLRHGQTDWNAARRIQGQRNSDLTAQGRAEAAAQGAILTRLGVRADTHRFYCSPLRRTRQTAELALPGHDAVFDDRLKEIFMGDWEGYLYADAERVWPAEFARFPTTLDRCLGATGGEGWQSVKTRATAFLADLDTPSVIVSHGAIGAVIRGLLCGLDRTAMAVLQAEQGVVLEIAAGRETTHR